MSGRKIDKRYGITIICVVPRARSLEACPSLTSDSFLNVFRLLFARRGQPRCSRSDNETNFTGACRSVQESFNKGLRYTKETIPQTADVHWDFNPCHDANFLPFHLCSDQPENEEPLTPNHFLLQQLFANLPPGAFEQQNFSFKSWK